MPQLSLHVPRKHLPLHLGGLHQINHSAWLSHCRRSMINREDDRAIKIGATQLQSNKQQQQQSNNQYTSSNNDSTNDITQLKNTADKLKNGDENDVELLCDVDQQQQSSNQNNEHTNNENSNSDNNTVVSSNNGEINEMWSENPPSSASSGFSDDDSLAYTEGDPKTIEQIVEMVGGRGRNGLVKEYSEIRARAPDGTFQHARIRSNMSKNRYTDVLCYDHSRVILSLENNEPTSDYINANFVDGYKQKNAYISTQGRFSNNLY